MAEAEEMAEEFNEADKAKKISEKLCNCSSFLLLGYKCKLKQLLFSFNVG